MDNSFISHHTARPFTVLLHFNRATVHKATTAPKYQEPHHQVLRLHPLTQAGSVKQVPKAKRKTKLKASDWTEDETREMLTVWGPRYSKLRSASNKERIKTWNEIFIAYEENCPDSKRTLPQVKKRQQNLEYEYKLLKQRSQSTGEAGFKKIKEGFPYFDFFDNVMGHRNSVDPSKMALEGSSTFALEESSSTSLSPQGSVANTETWKMNSKLRCPMKE